MGLFTAIAATAAIGATTAAVSAQQSKAKKAKGEVEQAARVAAAEKEEKEAAALRAEEKIEAATEMTPEELAREETTFALEERQLPFLEERARTPGEELIRGAGEISEATLDAILAGAKAPGAAFESTLDEQLELVRQFVNKEAVKRGVFEGLPEGGIRFEQLGRAGIELAIKSAQERQIQRQQDLSNAAAVITGALKEEQLARGELSDFLTNIQELSTRARERAGKGVISGQQLALPEITGAIGESADVGLELAGVRATTGGETASQVQQGFELLSTLGQLTRPEESVPDIFEQETTKRGSLERISEMTGRESEQELREFLTR